MYDQVFKTKKEIKLKDLKPVLEINSDNRDKPSDIADITWLLFIV